MRRGLIGLLAFALATTAWASDERPRVGVVLSSGGERATYFYLGLP